MTSTYIQSKIDEIVKFRNDNKDKCTSTTHSFASGELVEADTNSISIYIALINVFGVFTIEVNHGDVKVLIPMNQIIINKQ